MTYFGERQLANFKPSRADRDQSARRRSSEKRANRDGNDASHCEVLRKLPCVVCMREVPSRVVLAGEVHHLKSGRARSERGMGMRASDQWGIPLSHAYHMELEARGSRNELNWFADHGIEDPCFIAEQLWRETRTGSMRERIVVGTKIIIANLRS